MALPTQGLSRRMAMLASTGALAAPRIAGAQGGTQGGNQTGARYPERPIRLIIPWTPGSSSDVQLRNMAELASRALGQTVVAENRAGAGGTLHALTLAREAQPDGYTIGQMHLSIVRRPYLVRAPQWDATTDFTHIIGLTGWLYGVAVRADSPFRTFAEMIAHARANPGRLSFATSGIATTNHLAMEDIAARERVELTHVPFRGSADGVTGVLSGNVDMIADASSWAPQVEAGGMRLLCVWTAERVARFAEVPTLRELGHDMVITSPYGISGPRGMDPGVVRVLHDTLKAALMSPENTRVRGQFDMPLAYLDTEQYQDFIRRRAAYEREIVTRLGIRMDG